MGNCFSDHRSSDFSGWGVWMTVTVKNPVNLRADNLYLKEVTLNPCSLNALRKTSCSFASPTFQLFSIVNNCFMSGIVLKSLLGRLSPCGSPMRWTLLSPGGNWGTESWSNSQLESGQEGHVAPVLLWTSHWQPCYYTTELREMWR
jgi:hypothetical protein